MLTCNKNRRGSSVVSEKTGVFVPLERCRICLKVGDIQIFGKKDISQEIMEFGCVEISYSDNLPQHICGYCHSLLESAILFRKTAKETEEILQNTEYLEDISVMSEDLDYKNIEILEDADDETFIKREYLEYQADSDSGSERDWKCEPFPDGNLHNIRQLDSDYQVTNNDKQIEMKLLSNYENDNELVMIIVSDKDEKDNLAFRCDKCNVKFENQDELVKHDAENHANTSVSQRACDVCHLLIDKTNYKEHIKQHREKYRANYLKKYGKVKCEDCGKLVNKSYYKYHKKMHGTEKEQAERIISCTICNKSFSTHYITDHMRRVHNTKQRKESPKSKKSLKCPVCDKMINADIYKAHLAKHGGSTKHYVCDQCGRVFNHSSAFKTHILTHGSELKYQCQFCPYRGLHLGLLKIHVRTHTGDYNYKCNECPARFITKSNLSIHLQRHQGATNYKCDTCNKGFYSKREVDRHIRSVHLKLKNYKCNICGKGFGHRDNLLGHQLKVHKRKKITDKRGRVPSYLQKEMEKTKGN